MVEDDGARTKFFPAIEKKHGGRGCKRAGDFDAAAHAGAGIEAFRRELDAGNVLE